MRPKSLRLLVILVRLARLRVFIAFPKLRTAEYPKSSNVWVNFKESSLSYHPLWSMRTASMAPANRAPLSNQSDNVSNSMFSDLMFSSSTFSFSMFGYLSKEQNIADCCFSRIRFTLTASGDPPRCALHRSIAIANSSSLNRLPDGKLAKFRWFLRLFWSCQQTAKQWHCVVGDQCLLITINQWLVIMRHDSCLTLFSFKRLFSLDHWKSHKPPPSRVCVVLWESSTEKFFRKVA